jgi:8-hydroxy-5-deazaflavin:NADPH oxidoreductase
LQAKKRPKNGCAERGSPGLEDAMRVGFIGAGMIGSTLAKLLVDAGYDVRVASRHLQQLQTLVARLGRSASVGTPADAAAYGEVVVLTVPLAAVPELAKELAPLLKGKIVLDTGNASERRDGTVALEATAHPLGSAGWAAAMFPGSRWVKAFNTVYFKTLESEAHRTGERVGIPLASDDRAALETAQQIVRQAGFDPVVVGSLVRGKEFEPDTPPYNTGMSGHELRIYWGQTAGTHATHH